MKSLEEIKKEEERRKETERLLTRLTTPKETVKKPIYERDKARAAREAKEAQEEADRKARVAQEEADRKARVAQHYKDHPDAITPSQKTRR